MTALTLPLDDRGANLETVGGKGMSLAKLANAGLPVPGGFHVTTDAYRRFVDENQLQARIEGALAHVDVDDPQTLEQASQAITALFAGVSIPAEVANAIVQAYASLPGRDPAVAVRSSATAEDLPEASFAGQQETYLNVSGASALLDATRKCWASLWTARAIGYRARHGIGGRPGTGGMGVALAVVVQTLVPAESAGILFTANPVNGQRDQALISASWGLGEAVVGGAVTPDTVTLAKPASVGRVAIPAAGQAQASSVVRRPSSLAPDENEIHILSRETADKQVQTVRVNGGTSEVPVPENLRRVPVLSDAQAIELGRLGVEIEALYGMPMDVEWALADGEFAILQARPITALPEPEVELPAEWPLPDPEAKYVRSSIVDLMPDPVSPLFVTLGFEYYGAGMMDAMVDLIGSTTDLSQSHLVTINGYVYQDTAMTFKQAWWFLAKMMPRFPRMMRNGVSYWREHGRKPYVETAARWQDRPLNDLSSTELLDGAREIMRAAMYSLTAQMLWMGACAGSEMLFTRVYDRLVANRLAEDVRPENATVFLTGWNSTPIRAEKSLYDLAMWCRTRGSLAAHIQDTTSEGLLAQLNDERLRVGVESEEWQAFRERFQAHVAQYGHIIYNLDFGKALPCDDPRPMLEMVKLYLDGEGANPHERQAKLEARRKAAEEAAQACVKGFKRWAYTKSLNWAQSLSEIREDGLADIGLGYPALRRLLRELGRRLVVVQVLQEPDDVYWMEHEELAQAGAALEQGDTPPSMVDAVRERSAFAQAAARLTPPPTLPPSDRVMGFKMGEVLAADESSQTGNTLKGSGTSAGTVTAPACVLHGPEDFGRMQPGSVLVAGITTPAWTPLFPLAAAVVTDIGGPLSHGSIVAREYGIPAVMGTGVATKRILNGQTITVDGSAGTVTLQ
jgi:pyruvate,water dikinase